MTRSAQTRRSQVDYAASSCRIGLLHSRLGCLMMCKMTDAKSFPYSVLVPEESRADVLRELERIIGPAGDRWCEVGNAITFRQRVDAQALEVVFALGRKPVRTPQ
jgi:hypothetical protein